MHLIMINRILLWKSWQPKNSLPHIHFGTHSTLGFNS